MTRRQVDFASNDKKKSKILGNITNILNTPVNNSNLISENLNLLHNRSNPTKFEMKNLRSNSNCDYYKTENTDVKGKNYANQTSIDIDSARYFLVLINLDKMT